MVNFNSGPAALPQEVLQEAAQSILDFEDGLSILEIPHRGETFRKILEEAETLVLDLLGLDNNYQVIWLQGGGRLQFSMLPMNFLKGQAGYIETGRWAQIAQEAASMYGQTLSLGSSEASGFDRIPDYKIPESGLDYIHITSNNTIVGTQYQHFPDAGSIPLIADMSSELFSRSLDYRKFHLIYAVAQKNIGPAGVTLVVVKKDLLAKSNRPLPDILSYKAMADNNSMVNTPPVFAIYCCLLNLRWIYKQELGRLESLNRKKADLLYNTLDASKLFYGPVEKTSRSMMNVCFRMHDVEKEAEFLVFAREQGIVGIKGHRSIGGFRAALYNAISLEAVEKLVETITTFESQSR